MRKMAALVLVAAAGCLEPPKTGQMETVVSSLADLHFWDPVTQGRGHYAYDSVTGYGPDILPVLVAHLSDSTPTKIYDLEHKTGRNPRVSDAVFFILLTLTQRQVAGVECPGCKAVHKGNWEDFADDGVFLSKVLPNPIFCLNWDRAAQFKVQTHYRKLLGE